MTQFKKILLPLQHISDLGNKNSFLRDVVALVSGTTIAQLITVVSLPILTRIYSPDAFGVMAIFISITGIGTVISSLRYEMAIVLPESREEASNLFAGTIAITGFVSILIGFLLYPFWPWIVTALNSPELYPYFWLIPISILFNGGFQAIGYWCSREGLYNQLSIAKVANAVITAVIQWCVGLLGFANAGGLIISIVVGSGVSFGFMFFSLFIVDRTLLEHIRFPRIVSILIRYRKFPIYDNWAALLNTISWQLPSFFLASFFSSAEVGYYSIGTRLLRLPMSLVGSSIGQVFFQRAAKAKQDGNLKNLVKTVYHELVRIGLFPMLLLAIVGRDVFEVGLGKQWAEGGVYTQILSLWMFFWFISSPLSTIFRVLEKQEFSLVINILIFMTRFLSLYIGGIFGSIYLALGLFSFTGILLYGFLSLAIVHASGVPNRFIFKILFKEFLYFIPSGLILILLKQLLKISAFWVVISSAFIMVIYLFIITKRIQLTDTRRQEPV